MATIGYVTKNGDTYTGALKTLTISAPIQFIANTKKANDKAPDFRIMSGNIEVGAAWNKTSQNGGEYVSVKLEAPEFGVLYANLGQAPGQDDEDAYALIWNPS